MGAALIAAGGVATTQTVQLDASAQNQQDIIELVKASPLCMGLADSASTTSDIAACLDPKQNKIQAVNFEGKSPTVDFSGLTPEQVGRTIIVLPTGTKVALSDIINAIKQ